ncbi:MAG: haloacid dehalogenase type II [Pseudomonadota bacterium]
MTQPRALLFDVFGTVVDWRKSIMGNLERFFRSRGVPGDWEAFAAEWRALYQPAMAAVREGRRDYVILDVLHRENLDAVLAKRDLGGLNEAEKNQLNALWHRLDPWPDSAEGLRQLREKHVVAALSNGNIGMMANVARHGDLRWDAILGADIARDFKPKPAVYLRAAEALGLRPGECMMVAAHNEDLAAARALGLATAFILRADEHGPGQTTDLAPAQDWDVVTDSLTGLAARLAA